jgi:methyltransferase-like protein/ubiquinone/menaquinone biosynthesis C-methylase UbiE
VSDSYDSVPYVSFAHAYTHPDSLCSLGRLFGLSPASPRRCRVLELGCASGGNLIPMAEQLPEAELVGIDRSRVQIDRGRALVGELGLSNIRLEQADILRVDPQAIGSFDYVICHGVFSWVPREVQDRILTLTAGVLRPRGLAFISYNVYPGWHMRELVRHMMVFHQRRFAEPGKQLEQARALLDFVAGAVQRRAASNDPHALLLGKELDKIRAMPDAYLFHEHLERDNTPIYFHEFVERLQGLPLRYLCDTDLNLMVARDMPDDVIETLGRIADDQIRMEQYLDFIRNRQFRTSVLCRIEAEPQRRLQPARVESLRWTMAAQPTSTPVFEPGVELGFACSSGARISSGEPLTKAALLELCERWPSTLDLDELIAAASARLHAAGHAVDTPDRQRLAADLIECLLRKAVIARSWQPAIATSIPEQPKLSAFNRIMAEREGWIASLHHHRVQLAAPVQKLASLLDGTRDRAALLAELVRLVDDKELSFRAADDQTNELRGDALLQVAGTFVDEQLAMLLRLPALLA